jgi:hypothetical protein
MPSLAPQAKIPVESTNRRAPEVHDNQGYASMSPTVLFSNGLDLENDTNVVWDSDNDTIISFVPSVFDLPVDTDEDADPLAEDLESANATIYDLFRRFRGMAISPTIPPTALLSPNYVPATASAASLSVTDSLNPPLAPSGSSHHGNTQPREAHPMNESDDEDIDEDGDEGGDDEWDEDVDKEWDEESNEQRDEEDVAGSEEDSHEQVDADYEREYEQGIKEDKEEENAFVELLRLNAGFIGGLPRVVSGNSV